MASYILVNIGLGNGLLTYVTKALPEPMLTYHQISKVCGMYMRAISLEVHIRKWD